MESMDEKSRLGGGEASSAGVQEQTTVEPASAPKEPHWLDDEIVRGLETGFEVA
jgi:hypothetical protein